jgi:predicted metal-binding membrane protein
VFLGVSALLFAASAAVTIAWCASMSAMGEMPMPGSRTMSMAWLLGQTWPGAAASFLGLWMVMMVAMMLPSLVPMLSRYRRSVRGANGRHLHGLTALVGAGYFVVWAVLGVAVWAAGAGVMAVEMRWERVGEWQPIAVGVILLLAGGVQFTSWKARQLALWREGPARGCLPAPSVLGAWRYGLRLGVRCSHSCGSLMLALLAIGMMNLVAMAVVTLVIFAERLAPAPLRVARVAGAVIVVVGVLTIARV